MVNAAPGRAKRREAGTNRASFINSASFINTERAIEYPRPDNWKRLT
jgi:hypothetical protein